MLLLWVRPPTFLRRQVFDIGAGCDEPARKVAELSDYLQEVTRLSGGRQQVFGAGDDKRSTAIKYLAVVRECETVDERHSTHQRCQASQLSVCVSQLYPVRLLRALSSVGLSLCLFLSVCVSLCVSLLLSHGGVLEDPPGCGHLQRAPRVLHNLALHARGLRGGAGPGQGVCVCV